MSSLFVSPSRRGHHYSQYSALEWRRLLRLLAHLEALPTSTARASLIAKLQSKNAEVVTALLQLVAAHERANATGFMTATVIRHGELRRRIDALMDARRPNV